MTYTIKVTKSGKGVTSTDPRDFILDASFAGVMRLSATPTSSNVHVTTTPDNQYTNVTIAHGLGYKPFYQAFVKWNDSAMANTPIWQNGTSGAGWLTGGFSAVDMKTSCDSTNIYLSWHNNGADAGTTLTAYYRVFIGEEPLP